MRVNRGVVKGSLILLIAFNVFNGLNFVFHFFMARMLSVSDYGILATLFTITYVLAVFSESIQIVITKYSVQENEKGKLKNIIKKSFKKAFFVSVLLFVVYLAAAVPMSRILEIKYLLVALNGVILFSIFLSPVTRGVLQGKKRFKALGVNMAIEAVIKLCLAILFVYIGWRVYGALIGTLVGMGIALFASFFSLGDIMKSKEEKSETSGIYGYSLPAFLIILVILMFYSIDVIIVKILFPADTAGVYAIASILAKTIFFGTQPVSRAMFPITAEGNGKDGKSKPDNAFMNAMMILIPMIVIALAVFYFAPNLIIKIFSGKELGEAASILFYLGVAVSLISFANLILLYKLSLGKIKRFYYLFVFLGVEIALMIYFSANLFQFSIAFITSAAIFLWGAVFLMNE